MTVRTEQADRLHYQGTHCELTLERAGNGVVILRISGQDVGEFGPGPMEELRRLVKRDMPAALFIDARNAQGASLDVSSDWAQWLASHRSLFREINMLTSSRFVQMTADFVRRYAGLTDLMRVYTEAAAFDEALAQRAPHRPR